MMLIQTGHVVHIVFGFDTGWDPQRRDDGSMPFAAIVRRHRSHVALGVLSLVAGLLISPVAGGLDVADHRRPHSGDPDLLVDQPALAGTGFSPRWPAGDSGGDDARRPSPSAPGRCRKCSPALGRTMMNGLLAIHGDPELRELHEEWLPGAPAASAWPDHRRPRRRRGEARGRRNDRGRRAMAQSRRKARHARRPRADLDGGAPADAAERPNAA